MDEQSAPELHAVTLGEALLGRRSVRRFDARAVPDGVLQSAIRTAAVAPSPHGTAPWRFCVLATAQSRHALAVAMGDVFLADMRAAGVPEASCQKRHAASVRLLSEAPTLLLASLSFVDLDQYDDPQRQQREWMLAEHCLGSALQNVMLALAAAGVGSVWRCAPMFCESVVREVLDLPADWRPRAMLAIGYPAGPAAERRGREPIVLRR